jgi:CheY-like chemotaxis protein
MPVKFRPPTSEFDASSVDVIIVDDDADFRESMLESVQQLGFVAIAARNGAEALRLARDRPPRLFLLDLEMPVVNGWQFLERRRASPALSKVPVIVVSARRADAARCRDVDGHLEKPVDEAKLLEAIGQFLASALASGPSGQLAAPDRGASTILVVDDDDDTRASVSELLEDQGYRVARANNGQEAEASLRTIQRPDCIVLDLWMPVMDGWRFTTRLQQLGPPPIPIVVITAAEPYWGYPVPLAHVQRKPLHPETFLALIGQLVSASQREREEARGAAAAGGRARED